MEMALGFSEFTAREFRVLSVLKSSPVSAADISKSTGFCDPRGYVRSLRNKGGEY